MSDFSIEAKAEKLCDVIMKKDEFWETKNKAILLLIDLVLPYENQSDEILDEVFSAGFFRLLKEPVKAMICDLRSQQVRDISNLLSVISQICGDRMKGFLRDSFNSILDGIKVPNKVMSGYVDECILLLVRNVTFKSAIQLLVNEVKDNKAKYVRERCLDYINEILINWDVNDREADILCEAIRFGLEDAAVKGREIARSAYMNMYQRFPKKTEKIKSNLTATSLKVKLQSAEAELSLNTSSSTVESGFTSATTSEKMVAPPSTSMKASAPPTPRHEKRTSDHLHTASKPSLHHSTNESLTSSSGSSSSSGAGHNTRSSASHSHSTATHHSSIPSHVVPSTPSHKDRDSAGAGVPSAAAAASLSSSSGVGHLDSRATIAAFRQTARRRSMVANPFESITSSIHTSLDLDEDDEAGSGGRPSPTKSNPSPSGGGSPAKGQHIASPDKKKSGTTAAPQDSPSKKAPVSLAPAVTSSSATTVTHGSIFSYPSSNTVDSLANETNPLRSDSSLSNSSINFGAKNIQLNCLVQVSRGKDTTTTGLVRFIGKTQFAAGVWIGVELFTEAGKNNGSVQGVSYFECPPNRGLFVKEENVEVLSADGAAHTANTAPSSSTPGIGYGSDSDGQQLPPRGSPTKKMSCDNIGDEIRNALNTSSSFVKSSNQPPLPSVSPMVHGHPSSVNESNGLEKKHQLRCVLKLKVSQLLETLNGQMDLVKQLEEDERTHASFSVDAYRNMIDEIVDFTTQELELIHSFKNSLASQQLY